MWWKVFDHAMNTIAIFLVLFLLYMGFISSAKSHEWYDVGCCSSKDCAPVLEIRKPLDGIGEIFRSEQGEVIVLPGDAVIRKPSKDSRFHVCMRDAVGFEIKSGRKKFPICIYYPTLY